MSNYPDFESHGYQVEQILGSNRNGGRVTYKALTTDTQLSVVIKQFQFAATDASWTGYNAHFTEVKMLRSLHHPRIPRYLDVFETPNGFCLVQEYKKAVSLAQIRRFEPHEIKQIAVAVLEVLVYLQKQQPPVIHRDLKPENILIDRSHNLRVYLVDFGFAREGGGEVAASSVVKGTFGFMPPEQLFKRQLTAASDLYSLGATLICLLTQTKSTEIHQLIDDNSRFKFKHLLPKLNPQFVSWLEKMVSSSSKTRYPDAATALKALQPIPVLRNTSQRHLIAMGLTTLGTLAMLGTGMVMWQLHGSVWRLQLTRECPGCNLENANLQNANLIGANLRNANLRNANLQNAQLAGVRLEGAKLLGAKLSKAYLLKANLNDTDFRNASLENANLRGANLKRANLEATDLQNSELSYANLEDANFNYANLTGTNFKGAKPQRATFKSPKMIGVTWVDGKTMQCPDSENPSSCRWE